MSTSGVLIVEDEEVIAQSMKEMLEEWGYCVCGIADTGEDAVKAAERERPDLVLMDMKLKGEIGGVEAARVIRERLGTPVIFLSGYLDEQMKDIGPAGFLSKPVDVNRLHGMLKKALKG